MPQAKGRAELFERGIGRGGDDELRLVGELDANVVGWLITRTERPAENAAAQLVREQGWTRLAVDA